MQLRGGITMKANEEIRKLIEKNRLKYWEVAYTIGISPSWFTVWMRTPMDEEKKQRTLKAINEIVAN